MGLFDFLKPKKEEAVEENYHDARMDSVNEEEESLPTQEAKTEQNLDSADMRSENSSS